MVELIKTMEPFRFYSRLHLTELTGLKASNLDQLLLFIKEVPDSCIYHHTHKFFQEFQYLSLNFSNDFAHWVTNILGEIELGEALESIDIIQFSTIKSLREKIINIIETYLNNNPHAKLRFVESGEEFYFSKSITFILPTNYIVYNLKEFIDAMNKITIDSIYFHIFEARLRLEKSDNDFSNWISSSIGDKLLAEKISNLDPYSYTLEDLRKTIIRIIERRIAT